MKKLFLIVLIAAVVFSGGCSNDSNVLKKENEQLKSIIIQLENDINDRNTQISELQNRELKDISINYIENASSNRFVEKQCDLLALPVENSLGINSILENTVVSVIDTAYVNDNIWLYISIPVYDTPSNFKGWVKETDTTLYTKDKVDKVQSDVRINEGEYVYETYDFASIDSVEPYKAQSGEHGRIEEKKNGYVKIQCAGGKIIWVKEASIIYPEVD